MPPPVPLALIRHDGGPDPVTERTIHRRLLAVGVRQPARRAQTFAVADDHLSRLATYDTLMTPHRGRFDNESVVRVHLAHAVFLRQADPRRVDGDRVMRRTARAPCQLANLLWAPDHVELLSELAVARWALEGARRQNVATSQLIRVRIPIAERVVTQPALPTLGQLLEQLADRALPRIVPMLAASVAAGGQARCIATRHDVDPHDAYAFAVARTRDAYWVGAEDPTGDGSPQELTAARLEAALFHVLQMAGLGTRDARAEAEAQRDTLAALTAFQFGLRERPPPGSQSLRSHVNRLRRRLYGELHGHGWQACAGRLQPPPTIALD